MAKYWETEIPEEARIGSVLLRHYPEAQKLQLHGQFRGDDGEWRMARVVALDLAKLGESPDAAAMIRRALEGSGVE